MKKLIPLICFLAISRGAVAQKSSIDVEAMHTERITPTDHDFYLTGRYDWLNKYDSSFGIVVEVASDANVDGVALKFLYAVHTKKHFMIKFSMGPEFNQQVRSKGSYWGLTENLSFSTKSQEERVKWKLQGDFTVRYSKDERIWYRGYLCTSPFVKWIDIGIASQSHVADLGMLVRISFVPHMRYFLITDGQKATIGLNIYGAFK